MDAFLSDCVLCLDAVLRKKKRFGDDDLTSELQSR